MYFYLNFYDHILYCLTNSYMKKSFLSNYMFKLKNSCSCLCKAGSRSRQLQATYYLLARLLSKSLATLLRSTAHQGNKQHFFCKNVFDAHFD